MKIGIIAPSPAPFTIGGAEKLFWGLLRAINSQTSHQAELIKLPTREHSFWDLVDSYEQYFKLDVTHFDLVISTKYPSWMVEHPNHVCYMVHTLRGFYDCFHYLKLPPRYQTEHPAIRSLQAQLANARPDRAALREVFAQLHSLRSQTADLPADAFAFPGSLIRELVVYFDRVGLRREAIRKFFAISQTVADRTSYFPEGAKVTALRPPSNLEGLHAGKAKYLFTASRLDGPKRIDLLISAMKFVSAPTELRIAGEGPEAARLKELAKDDPRIVFLGYRSDAQLVNDYADALAVLFVPAQEDYGLITVEAMMSGKPVITVNDSGGPTELVEHGQNGYCVDPEPAVLGEAMETLCRAPDLAASMGRRGQQTVQSITWPETVRTLLGEAKSSKTTKRSRRLMVATSFPVTPVRGGGQARIFHFYQNLAPAYSTEIVTLAPAGTEACTLEIAPGVREIRIPKSAAHEAAECQISSQVEWFPVTDVALPRLLHLTPRYLEALAAASAEADTVVACHPYTFNALHDISSRPLWYEAQDVEFLLKGAVLPKTPEGIALIEEVKEIERRCCERADLVLACSETDARDLGRLYDCPEGKIHLVPNGVDTRSIPFISRETTARLRRQMNLGERSSCDLRRKLASAQHRRDQRHHAAGSAVPGD